MTKIAHQTRIEVEATNVGARHRMVCSAGDARTPLMSKQAAESAAEKHQWEHDGSGPLSPQRKTGKTTRRRKGRSV